MMCVENEACSSPRRFPIFPFLRLYFSLSVILPRDSFFLLSPASVPFLSGNRLARSLYLQRRGFC